MKRIALIISNPGVIGEENYCEGVFKDVQNYYSYLISPLGGYWRLEEIVRAERPGAEKIKYFLNQKSITEADYLLAIFTGHGGYSANKDTNILELCEGEELDYREFLGRVKKTSIILDCCRKVYYDFAERMVKVEAAVSGKILNPSHCRYYYDNAIKECREEFTVLFGCDIDEYSYDSASQGGYYSYSLLRGVKTWEEQTDVDLEHKYSIRSIVAAHNDAVPKVQLMTSNKQNPKIDKPRSGPYFPFAIIA